MIRKPNPFTDIIFEHQILLKQKQPYQGQDETTKKRSKNRFFIRVYLIFFLGLNCKTRKQMLFRHSPQINREGTN
ncbi:unnamed protein product [Brassica oleracea var. botrytis]